MGCRFALTHAWVGGPEQGAKGVELLLSPLWCVVGVQCFGGAGAIAQRLGPGVSTGRLALAQGAQRFVNLGQGIDALGILRCVGKQASQSQRGAQLPGGVFPDACGEMVELRHFLGRYLIARRDSKKKINLPTPLVDVGNLQPGATKAVSAFFAMDPTATCGSRYRIGLPQA